MKIEKLTENKIRIVVSSSDLKVKNLDVHSLMTKALEEQNFFTDLLDKARKEVGFNADGCKLLIEAFSSFDDVLVFTITKYSPTNNKNNIAKKKLIAKRKSLKFFGKQTIYQFANFDGFCDFCNYIGQKSNFDIKQFSKDISLYLYQNTYYLVVKNINTSYEFAKFFYSATAEFANLIRFSNTFENKLLEHGKIIMKKNAILKGIQYFVSE